MRCGKTTEKKNEERRHSKDTITIDVLEVESEKACVIKQSWLGKGRGSYIRGNRNLGKAIPVAYAPARQTNYGSQDC